MSTRGKQWRVATGTFGGRGGAGNTKADEIAQVDHADPDSLGAETALRLEVYCGDCEAAELYAGRGSRVVRLSFELGIHLAGTREEQAAASR